MKRFFKKKKNIALIILLVLCILINLISRYSTLIENYYSTNIYSIIGKMLRTTFGKISFSLGDILYTIVILFFVYRILRFFKKLFTKKINKAYLLKCFYTLSFSILIIYFFFNILWGINYNRKGIGYQLQLNTSENYSTAELDTLVKDLVIKANANRTLLGYKINFPNNATLFNEAVQSYKNAAILYPYLQYEAPSIKAPIFKSIIAYLGTSGYYNPFTGEAQANTIIPIFTLPYVTCHEMAHQLGYATEDEANFVGYIAASNSFDPLFKYSSYLNLYQYANRELFLRDSSLARKNYTLLDTLVKIDLHELHNFWNSYENPVEKLTTKLYSQYLKANQQPQGIDTYNHVTALLLAYKRKYNKL